MEIKRTLPTTTQSINRNKTNRSNSKPDTVPSLDNDQKIHVPDGSESTDFIDMKKVAALQEKISSNNYEINLDNIAKAIEKLNE